MEVILTRNTEKQLKKAPANIVQKLMYWVSQLEERSIRLSKSWRSIYTSEDNILVIEVHNHEY